MGKKGGLYFRDKELGNAFGCFSAQDDKLGTHQKHIWGFFGFGVTFIDSINDYIDPINNLWIPSMCLMGDGNVGLV